LYLHIGENVTDPDMRGAAMRHLARMLKLHGVQFRVGLVGMPLIPVIWRIADNSKNIKLDCDAVFERQCMRWLLSQPVGSTTKTDPEISCFIQTYVTNDDAPILQHNAPEHTRVLSTIACAIRFTEGRVKDGLSFPKRAKRGSVKAAAATAAAEKKETAIQVPAPATESKVKVKIEPLVAAPVHPRAVFAAAVAPHPIATNKRAVFVLGTSQAEEAAKRVKLEVAETLASMDVVQQQQ
jgi:hypothetical protein